MIFYTDIEPTTLPHTPYVARGSFAAPGLNKGNSTPTAQYQAKAMLIADHRYHCIFLSLY